MDTKKHFFLFLFLSVVCSVGVGLLPGCSLTKSTVSSKNDSSQGKEASEMPFAKLYTAVWMQRAAEYKALCLQAYNLATLVLDRELSSENKGKKLAVITDIDETFLDNSPNSVEQSWKNQLYDSESWHLWCDMAQADTIPGALDFFSTVASRGVEVFYISNRSERDRPGTIENLRKFGFPYADDAHVLLRTTTSNKDARRAIVHKNYKVIMYLGDNLGDFSSLFDTVNEKDREAALYRMKREIGSRFIVLPNPNYGTWESALFEGGRLQSDRQADIYRRKAKGYTDHSVTKKATVSGKK